MRKVILHLGLAKCGSTFIQQTLHENESVLAQHGILQPKTGVGGNPAYGRRHMLLTRSLTVYGPSNEMMDGLHRELSQSRAETAIISHETMAEETTPDVLGAAFSRYEAKVVLYCRHPIDYVESRYRQWVIMGVRTEIVQYAATLSRTLKLHALLEGLRGVFGAPNVTLRSIDLVEPQLNLADDLLRAADIDVPRLAPSAMRNSRRNNGSVLFYLAVNRERHVYDRGSNKVPDPGFDFGSNEGRLLTSGQMDKILEVHGAAYERLVADETGRPALPSLYAARPWDEQFFDAEVRARATAAARLALDEAERQPAAPAG